MNLFKKKTPSTLLGLALESGRLEGVVLRRQNGSLLVQERFVATLTLDPLTADPELAGREILNHLQAAGVRERDCVVAVPLKWALAAHTEVPKLPESDLASFLQIEAERGFPTDISTLQVATSRPRTKGQQHATFIGIPRNHVDRLEKVLRAARLRPVSFSLGITALQPASGTRPGNDSEGVLALAVGDNHVGLQVTSGGGVVALRALEGGVEKAGGGRLLQADLVARESRITLGQLPAELRESVKTIRLFGPRDAIEQLAREIRPRFEPGGLKLDLVSTYPAGEFGKTIPAETPVSAAFSLAARQLIGRNDPFEFLPPRISAWQQATAKYAPGKLRKVALAGAAVLVGVVVAFGYQEWRLAQLRSEWRGMASKVGQLEGISTQISRYRPWFDRSFRCLSMIKELTMAFPEDGSVTAKTLEIRDLNEVTCSGTAENYSAFTRTMHQLSTNDRVSELNFQTRGKTPMQFTVDFRLNGGVNEKR